MMVGLPGACVKGGDLDPRSQSAD